MLWAIALLCVLLSPLEVRAGSDWLDFNMLFNDEPFLQNSDFNSGLDYWETYPTPTMWISLSDSGVGSTGCAYGHDESGGRVILYQTVYDNLEEIEGYCVAFRFWFKSTYNDDTVQANISYQIANGGPWTQAPSQWLVSPGDDSDYWSQAHVRINAALPSSIYGMRVEISAQDGSGGDIATSIYVDEANVEIVHYRYSDLFQCNISLGIHLRSLRLEGYYDELKMRIELTAEGKDYDRQYFVSQVTIIAILEPHQNYLFPWDFSEMSDQYVGSYLSPYSVALLRIGGPWLSDPIGSFVSQRNNAVPEIQCNPTGGDLALTYSRRGQGADPSGRDRTQLTFRYCPQFLSSVSGFATHVFCAHTLDWWRPYPQQDHSTGEWYVKILAYVDISYAVQVTEPMAGYLLVHDATYLVENRVYGPWHASSEGQGREQTLCCASL